MSNEMLGTLAYLEAGLIIGKQVQNFTRRLLHDNSGATAVEYGLVIGIISVSIIVGMQSFSNQLVVLYQIVNGYTSSAMTKS